MRNTLILAALLAAAPFAASAEGLSYNYVEGGWNRTEISVNSDADDLDGGYLLGSWQIAEPVYVFAGYQRATENYSPFAGITAEITVQQAHAGIGYRQEMTERVDFNAEFAVLRNKGKVESRVNGRRLGEASDSSNLGFANLGLRGKPSPRTEAWIKAGYIDGSDVDKGEFVGTLGGQVNFTRTWGLVAEAQFVDNANQYKVGVRASF
ncbi:MULTISPECIES: hypothetical protein [Xanthomonas]|uniref:Ax21 family protein n=1 Tax=Xanthomonas euvesicatoria TaxID=456327 RepID=A0AAX4FI07_XANEU|nr:MULTISPECIES: hypothetical protein [Xanthomonas]MBO9858029.1 hypothetical protein [Xanthomonas sp. A1809]MBV6778499.1 hypothetical protein [Xanthomonas campestris pv. carissae]MBV6858877.1 hypothetical protein [Xanthomonas campestris pv. zingibericola]MCP3040830.1 hypothetical protein [Xanthomonas euvesicatoria pv. allii]MCP3052814.1 hypothetical protein [Xanthomonas euvesicatoria pv. allii]